MTLPNFLLIGAAKSGTSSVYMYLKQHPDIFMSPIKEPHYFSFDTDSKLTKGPGDPIYKAVTDFNEYQRLFDGVTFEKAIGEASTSYLYRPEAPGRIHDLLPDAKLIAILRDPAERAFSAYMHVVRDRRETSRDFAEALQREDTRKKDNWDPIWHFTSVSSYYEQLSRYVNLFNREQFRVFLYSDLIVDKRGTLREMFEFLGVDPDFVPDSSVRFNVSGEQKSRGVEKLTQLIFNTPNPIRWLSRRLVPELWRGNLTNWVRQRNLKRKPIPADIRVKLIDLFREDILKLQGLIDRDLSPWLEP